MEILRLNWTKDTFTERLGNEMENIYQANTNQNKLVLLSDKRNIRQ